MTKEQIAENMTALALEIEDLENRKKSEMKKYNDEINSKNNRLIYLAHQYADYDKEKEQMELDFDGKPIAYIGSGEDTDHPDEENKVKIIDLREDSDIPEEKEEEETEENNELAIDELVDAPELSN